GETGKMSASNATSAIYVCICAQNASLVVDDLNHWKAYYAVRVVKNCVDGIEAQQVFGYAIYRDGENTKLSYPLEKFKSDIFGRSFGYGRFIQRMREKATTLPKYAFFPSILT
ncbi:putative squalene monooxygenase, partial [Tanacetum coccineum]